MTNGSAFKVYTLRQHSVWAGRNEKVIEETERVLKHEIIMNFPISYGIDGLMDRSMNIRTVDYS